MTTSAYLEAARDAWHRLGEQDALHAILTEPGTENGKWDPEAFWQRGTEDVNFHLGLLRVAADLAGLPLPVPEKQTALDFGCGVGRLSRALKRSYGYQRVIGLDIAPSMIAKAWELNADSGIEFSVNPGPGLDQPDNSVDLVYTQLVLQHLDVELQHGYLREFLRVLKPGGFLVAGTICAPLRPWKGSQYSQQEPAVQECHGLDVEAAIRTIRQSGGGVLDLSYDSTPLVWSGGVFAGFTYYCAKEPTNA